MDLCYPILPFPLPQLQSFSTAAFVRSSHFWCHLRSFPSPSTVLASLSSLPFPPLLPLWHRCGEEGFGEPREGNGRKELGGGAWKRDRGRRRRTLEVEEWSGAAVEASRGEETGVVRSLPAAVAVAVATVADVCPGRLPSDSCKRRGQIFRADPLFLPDSASHSSHSLFPNSSSSSCSFSVGWWQPLAALSPRRVLNV